VQLTYRCPVATPHTENDQRPPTGLSNIIAIISNKQPMGSSWW